MEYRVEINGISSVVRYHDEDIEAIFLPLLQRLNTLYAEKQRRILVLLAAPPGAGKSTLLDLLCRLCAAHPELQPLTAIGMDGFHRRQQYLLTHTVAQGGERIPMVRIKGAPVTFDLPLLEEKAKSTLTPVVISNMDEIKELIKLSGSVTVGETPVIRIKK